ncbi:YlbL family protein [Mycetocola miduiensis]|uniref:endopeptidase La n=1 Tax=Mycetocola miduiensis TaxID=995034 RepID=A0A1I4ZF17_9MICO|nr:S16 family serine protease [Mycetocola miduiensis]SFN48864.1 PDZ domain-containing protein [Mycetocola miduiensis]
MSLFNEHPPEIGAPALYSEAEIAAMESTRRRRNRGWLALAVSFVLLLGLALWPTSYVIQQPGPVFDTLGSVTIKDKDVPLVTVDGAETYETGGALDMLTVQALGNREQRPSWFEVALAWFSPSKAIVPVDAVFPAGVSTEEREAENAALMIDSQQDAIAAALSELGYEFPAQLAVGHIAEGAPADGKLKVDDEILAVNDVPVSDLASLRSAIAENGTESPAVFDVTRGGVPTTVSITPVPATSADGEKTSIIGVATKVLYDFPVDVTIQLDNVGGPSAGMMFALGIIDKMTPGELNGGEKVAGTGTIDAEGVVGPIGGIRQKLYGAVDAGADYFLAPEANCNEVVGHVPDGIRVLSVATLDDSLAALEAVASSDRIDDLPTCELQEVAG